MALLGAYWQDIQFQNGGIPSVFLTAGSFRSSYSRCSIGTPSTLSMKTNAFISGAITTGWMSFRAMLHTTGTGAPALSTRIGGFGQFSSSSNCLMIGSGVSAAGKITLYKYDGTTLTALAAESGTSLSGVFGDGTNHYFAIQVIGYGASASVNVYFDGSLVIAATGIDVTVSGMTAMDCLVFGPSNNTSNKASYISEAMASTDDIRSYIGLQTLALTGAGTTTQFSNNTYTNINGTTYSDANPIYDNTNGHIQEYNITDPISPGAFSYVAVVQAARAAKSIATPAVTKMALGYLNVNQALGPSFGSDITLTTVPTCYEQIDTVDLTTGVAFVQADMTAEQLAVKAVT